MQINQDFDFNNFKLPLRTKIYLTLCVVFGFALLLLFTSTFFIIALITGVTLFIINLFTPKKKNPNIDPDVTTIHVQQIHTQRKDKDIIDI